jgi:hypothetical protein
MFMYPEYVQLIFFERKSIFYHYLKNSDDEQQQSTDTIPIPLMKGIESTSLGLDYIPSKSHKHHQQINEEQTHIRGTATTKKKNYSTKREIQDYDNLENLTKSKRKPKVKHSFLKINYLI